MGKAALGDRRTYIGGSDIGAILGVSPWCSPLQLYMRKIGATPEQPDSPHLRRGRLLEPVVRQMYAEDRGIALCGPRTLSRGGWLVGHLDDSTTEPRVVEIKTASAFRREAWGDPGTDEIPLYYTAQAQFYMHLGDFPAADIAVLIGGDDFRIYTVQADRELQAAIIAKAQEFWQRVRDRNPPDPTTIDDTLALYPRSIADRAIVADAAIASDVAIVAAQQEAIDRCTNALDAAKVRIQARMGDAAAVVRDGSILCTWKSQERRTVDVKELRRAQPDIAAEFERVTATRVFRVK